MEDLLFRYASHLRENTGVKVKADSNGDVPPVGECLAHQLLHNVYAGPGLSNLSLEKVQIPSLGCIVISMHWWMEVSETTLISGCLAGVVQSALVCRLTF